MNATVSIITPWRNHPELLPDYEATVYGVDELILIDNGSDGETAERLDALARRYTGTCIHNEVNRGFAPANQQGLARANGDIIIFLNNDVISHGDWLDQVRREVRDGALYGPSTETIGIAGRNVEYVEGWCVAATRRTWEAIGGWDEELFQKPYWEDVDLSFRAWLLGMGLIATEWPIVHIGRVTARDFSDIQLQAAINRMNLSDRMTDELRALRLAHQSTNPRSHPTT